MLSLHCGYRIRCRYAANYNLQIYSSWKQRDKNAHTALNWCYKFVPCLHYQMDDATTKEKKKNENSTSSKIHTHIDTQLFTYRPHTKARGTLHSLSVCTHLAMVAAAVCWLSPHQTIVVFMAPELPAISLRQLISYNWTDSWPRHRPFTFGGKLNARSAEDVFVIGIIHSRRIRRIHLHCSDVTSQRMVVELLLTFSCVHTETKQKKIESNAKTRAPECYE